MDEKEGRDLLNTFLQKYAKKIDYTEDRYNPVDVFLLSKTTRKQ